MIFLQVIRSEVNGDLYIGICEDIANRLNEHNRGKNGYTKGLKPRKVIYSEEFVDWKSAREKEKYYKSGKEYLKKNWPRSSMPA